MKKALIYGLTLSIALTLTACGQPRAEEPGASAPAASAAVQTASPEESTEPTATPEPSEETPTAPAETDTQPDEDTTQEPPAEDTTPEQPPETSGETETTRLTGETEPTAKPETTPAPVQKPAEDKSVDNPGNTITQTPQQPAHPSGGDNSNDRQVVEGLWIPDSYLTPKEDPVRADPNSQTSGENTWEHVQEAWEGIS